jgi:hypothetical protein
MLMPRFTIRTLLALLTLCACGFVLIGTAFRGQYWAWGVTIALVTLVATTLVHGALFGIVWLFSQMSLMPPGLASVPPFPQSRSGDGDADGSSRERMRVDQACES